MASPSACSTETPAEAPSAGEPRGGHLGLSRRHLGAPSWLQDGVALLWPEALCRQRCHVVVGPREGQRPRLQMPASREDAGPAGRVSLPLSLPFSHQGQGPSSGRGWQGGPPGAPQVTRPSLESLPQGGFLPGNRGQVCGFVGGLPHLSGPKCRAGMSWVIPADRLTFDCDWIQPTGKGKQDLGLFIAIMSLHSAQWDVSVKIKIRENPA